MNNYARLASIDVGQHIEKKGQLSYLSWAWAVDQLLRQDPEANWQFGEPKYFGETVMVSVTVTAFGKPVTMQLPVMDNRNNAVANPDARKISDAQMRCLVKAIACHGLGLYIYAGEDLPAAEDGKSAMEQFEEQYLPLLREAAMGGKDPLQVAFLSLPKSDLKTQFWAKHGDSLKAAAAAVGAK
jgi:hypothetical protein